MAVGTRRADRYTPSWINASPTAWCTPLPLTASAAPPPWRLTLFVLWSSQLITMLALSAVLPFLPLYVRYLGV